MSIADRRREHIEKLARQHGIMVNWRTRGFRRYEAVVEYRSIWVGQPTSPAKYLGALHEMGHCVDAHAAYARRHGSTLIEEAAAWDWALRHADPALVGKVSEQLRNRIGTAWATYLG